MKGTIYIGTDRLSKKSMILDTGTEISNRPITPHKGGRTERISARITPEDKAAIIARCEYLGITISDFIAAAARKAARDTLPWHKPKDDPEA